MAAEVEEDYPFLSLFSGPEGFVCGGLDGMVGFRGGIC